MHGFRGIGLRRGLRGGARQKRGEESAKRGAHALVLREESLGESKSEKLGSHRSNARPGGCAAADIGIENGRIAATTCSSSTARRSFANASRCSPSARRGS